MSSSAPMFNLDGVELKTPILLVSPDEAYAAIFEFGSEVAVLKSQAGRCIVSYPVRSQATPNPAASSTRHFEAQGYVKQTLPRDDFAGFVQRFMTVAGFTAGQVKQTLNIGKPCLN